MMFIPELHACKKKIGILQTTTKREVKVLGIDVWPHIIIFFDKVTAALAWLTAIIAAYLWLSYALRLFPYTKPWGDDLASYLQEFFLQMCDAIVRSIPSLFAVAIIFTLTRWFVRLAQALFTQIEVGTFKLTWFEPEFAQATSRLTSALTWLFAIVVAYPYIPGSHTEAFKGGQRLHRLDGLTWFDGNHQSNDERFVRRLRESPQSERLCRHWRGQGLCHKSGTSGRQDSNS